MPPRKAAGWPPTAPKRLSPNERDAWREIVGLLPAAPEDSDAAGLTLRLVFIAEARADYQGLRSTRDDLLSEGEATKASALDKQVIARAKQINDDILSLFGPPPASAGAADTEADGPGQYFTNAPPEGT